MYPSDYGYAAGNSCVNGTKLVDYNGGCKNNDWLYISNTYQWLMSPSPSYSNVVWGVYSVGQVTSYYSSTATAVRPVFFLNSSTSITDGEGTETNPYILS